MDDVINILGNLTPEKFITSCISLPCETGQCKNNRKKKGEKGCHDDWRTGFKLKETLSGVEMADGQSQSAYLKAGICPACLVPWPDLTKLSRIDLKQKACNGFTWVFSL